MIVLDTNVVSEMSNKTPHDGVSSWLRRFDVELALPTIAIAEIAYSVRKIPEDQRSRRLEENLTRIRTRFSERILDFTEEAALIFGEIMGGASQQGRSMSMPDGMIAAIAVVNGGKLATRNIRHFETTGLELINPWDF